MPAKYAQIGDKYYVPGTNGQLEQTTEQDIRGRMGDISSDTYKHFGVQEGDWRGLANNEAFSGGGIQQLDPSQVTFGSKGEVLHGGQQLNLGGSAAFVKPGTKVEDFGGLPMNQDFGNYLKQTNQTYTPEKGFSGAIASSETEKKASPFKSAFQEQNIKTGGATPINEAAGRAMTSLVNAPSGPDKSSLFLQEDPTIQNLVKAYQDFASPANQRKSLTETYQQMLKDSGVQALDTQLLNMKNVIEGSQEDIRNEVTKAGGFATDSQVLALTNARNKQLIKNYNTLLDTRNSKEKYMDTLIGLESQDREVADKKFEQSFNMGTKILELGQTMKKNAIESLDRVKQTVGWEGILSATQGDPYTKSLIEKTYGLPTGGLDMAVNQEKKLKAQAEEKRMADLKKTEAETANIGKPASVQEYEFAKSQGYKGTYTQYQNEDANRKARALGVLTQPQLQAKGYYDRTVESDQIISNLGDKFTGLSSYIGQYTPNILKSSDRQQLEQAEKNFINAVLRKESGAAIAKTEFDNAAQQYFPQPGDSKEVLAQKKQNRLTTMQSLQRQGGENPTNPTNTTNLRVKYNY